MYTLPKSVRVGVLRGGPSPEYDVSLQSGAHVLEQLSQTHRPIDILISKNGTWHIQGVERSPDRILKHVDVVFNALHGAYGEDGGVQDVLNHYGTKYTGSDKFASAVAMNKWMTKEHAKKAGIRTPIYTYIRRTDPIQAKVREIFNSIPHPMIVKPVSSGSSLGIYVVDSVPELLTAIDTVLSAYDGVLVEEYIKGKEVTCTVVNDFRGSPIYSFPPLEIQYEKTLPIWTYGSKYSDEPRIMYPTTLLPHEAQAVEDASKKIHDVMGLAHYSRSDFIVSPRRGVYFLEVNTLPGMTKHSLVPKALETVGVKMGEFIHHVLGLALDDK
jgi:D-alanine-D-alanine ligase